MSVGMGTSDKTKRRIIGDAEGVRSEGEFGVFVCVEMKDATTPELIPVAIIKHLIPGVAC